MDAEIASGPNIALFWMLGLGQVLSPILFTLLLFTSIWYHQESVIVSFLIKPSFLPPQGLIPSRFTLEPSAAQTEADLKKASVKETQGNSTGTPEIKSPGILVTNSNPTSNRFSMKYQISCIKVAINCQPNQRNITKQNISQSSFRKESLDSVDFELIKLGLHKSTEDIRAQYLQVPISQSKDNHDDAKEDNGGVSSTYQGK